MNELFQSIGTSAKSRVDNFQSLAQQMLIGVQQLGELNLAASKAIVNDSMQHVQAMLDVRDPQQMLTMQMGVVQPMAEKSASYLRQVFEIVSNTNAETGKLVEGQMKEAQQSFVTLMETAMKNAPTGSEAATSMFRNAFNATQEAINTAQGAARQAMATAEQNVSAMSDQALSTTRAAAGRNKA